jgi:anti-sigma B factor antagonist
MNTPSATFEMISRDAQAGVIRVHGALTSAAEANLMDAVAGATAEGARLVILDFEDMEFMNSTGIGLLVTLLVRANRAQQKLAACGLNEHYREIFSLTRLEEAFTIYGSVEDALAAV